MGGIQGDDAQLQGDIACENATVRCHLFVGCDAVIEGNVTVGGTISGGGIGPGAPQRSLSVNNAGADGWGATVGLHTGGVVGSPNVVGAFNGGGTGNKAILGHAVGFAPGIPASSINTLSWTWRNLLGDGGPFFNPPTAANVLTPYMNLLVDFNPGGGGDVRMILLGDDSLNPAITAAIGTYSNPGGLNTLTYSWTSAKAVCIVATPPDPAPGGVVPSVSVGALFTENAFSWGALLLANPGAIVLDAFPANPLLHPTGDGGMPAGSIVSGLMLISGDSGTLTRQGKHILQWQLNGTNLIA